MLRKLTNSTLHVPHIQHNNWATKNFSSKSYSHIKRILPKDVAWVVYDDERAHYYLIDVRSSEDYKKKRISGFLPYPFDQLEQKYVKLQEKDKRVFIHDDATSHPEPDGKEEPTKALKAADFFYSKGFKDVSVVEGSVDDLIRVGFGYWTGQ